MTDQTQSSAPQHELMIAYKHWRDAFEAEHGKRPGPQDVFLALTAAQSPAQSNTGIGTDKPRDDSKTSASPEVMRSAIGAVMPCGALVTNVHEAYEAGKRAATPAPAQAVLEQRVCETCVDKTGSSNSEPCSLCFGGSCWRPAPKIEATAPVKSVSTEAEPVSLESATGLVEQLREAGNDYTIAWGSGELYDKAADEIERLNAALAAPVAGASVEGGKWDGAEEWMPLAWELCAEESGEGSCEELIWEGGPIKEPWGERWLKYEDEAKRLIALVRKHATQPVAQPMSEEQAHAIYRKACQKATCHTDIGLLIVRATEAHYRIGSAGGEG